MNHAAKLSLVLLACAAGAGGGILARTFEESTPPSRADRQGERADSAAIGRIAARLAALEVAVAGSAAHVDSVASAGSDPSGHGGAGDGSAPGKGRQPVAPGEPVPRAPGAPPDPDPLAATLGRTFGYAEAEALFDALARDRGAIDDVIARIEKEIAASPRSADLHVALATAYGAKTAFGTPPGPEQGTVWVKAERAYDEAIRLDPEHWQARYGRAFGDSMAPEFVGLRPRAIRQFEELMEIQEKKPAAPEQVEVYLRLGTLLKDAGNVKKARETWKRGLARFPDDERIVEALALTEEK